METFEQKAKRLMRKSEREYQEQCKKGLYLVDKPLNFSQALNIAMGREADYEDIYI